MARKKESKEAKELREIKSLLQQQQLARQQQERIIGTSFGWAAIIVGFMIAAPLGILAWATTDIGGSCGWFCQTMWMVFLLPVAFIFLGIAGLVKQYSGK